MLRPRQLKRKYWLRLVIVFLLGVSGWSRRSHRWEHGLRLVVVFLFLIVTGREVIVLIDSRLLRTEISP